MGKLKGTETWGEFIVELFQVLRMIFVNISKGHIKKTNFAPNEIKPSNHYFLFKRPLPLLLWNAKRVLLLLVFLSFLSFSFSYFFEPLDVNVSEHRINTYWILLIHACIPIPIAFLFLSFINRSKKGDIAWTIGDLIIYNKR